MATHDLVHPPRSMSRPESGDESSGWKHKGLDNHSRYVFPWQENFPNDRLFRPAGKGLFASESQYAENHKIKRQNNFKCATIEVLNLD